MWGPERPEKTLVSEQNPDPVDRAHPLLIEREMRESYLRYALSVIHDRALPDVRDGLKPSQRRILVAMNDLHLSPRARYRKCAKIAGDTSGNYHPHGEGVIYPTLVRMAQPFRLREPLVDGQGNFGSIDGDPPAAMRYTEARMASPAELMLEDIDKETVDLRPNYDESRTEPIVLPGKFPNLLVNGSEGIAVGMSTALPPHNLNEVIAALLLLLDNPDCTIEEVMEVLPGPDFPTGGIICGRAGIVSAYGTGLGKITLRGRVHSEETEGKARDRLVVTEIPYEKEKTAIIERIADAVKDGRIEGIHDIRDESDRDGMRMVIELKKDAEPTVVENLLYKHSPLQSTYSIRNVALRGGRPCTLNIKEILQAYRDHRFDVIRRRTRFLLAKAEQRLHIVEGLLIAIQAIDEVVEIIKTSDDTHHAKARLEERFDLSPAQSQAIVDMRLGRLTGLEVTKLQDEANSLREAIAHYQRILAEDPLVIEMIREDLESMRAARGGERRSTISGGEAQEFMTEDLIAEEMMVVTVSRGGYVKRTPLDTYRSQGRGGRGVSGGQTKEGDALSHLFIASTHDFLLVVTDRGRIYWLKVWKLPAQARTARGRSIRNLIDHLDDGEAIRSICATRDFSEADFLLFATEQGKIKKTPLSDYSRPRKAGIIATSLGEGDKLVDTALVSEGDQILLTTAGGQVVRFDQADARPMGRTAGGVKGATLKGGDRVVDLMVANPSDYILIACAKGYGKRTKVSEFRLTKRGSQGVVGIRTTSRNGPVVNAMRVTEQHDILFVSSGGMMVRTSAAEVSVQGRATQGVRLVNLKAEDRLVAVARVLREDEAVLESEEATGASSGGKG